MCCMCMSMNDLFRCLCLRRKHISFSFVQISLSVMMMMNPTIHSTLRSIGTLRDLVFLGRIQMLFTKKSKMVKWISVKSIRRQIYLVNEIICCSFFSVLISTILQFDKVFMVRFSLLKKEKLNLENRVPSS